MGRSLLLRFTCFLFFVVITSTASFAQQAADSTAAKKDSVKHVWDHTVVAGAKLTQVSYTDWVAGGENALSYTALLDGKAVRDDTTTNWENTLALAYGQTRVNDLGFRKTDDKIDVASVLSYKFGLYVNPYVAATFKTQFAPGYIYPNDSTTTQVSDFFDPAYFTQSVGIGYQPVPQFRTRLGAALREIFANRFTVFSDDPSTPDVEDDKVEGGLESVSELETAIDDDLLLKSKLELFAPLKTLDEVVVHFDNTVTAVLSKYVNVNFTLLMINERPVSPRTQIKEGLAIGLTYTVF